MKSSTLYACIIAMLFVSSVTFSEIIPDPEGTGTSSGAYATASKGNPEYYQYQERWWCETTTEAGTFTWKTTAYAYAGCSCLEDGGWVLAVADASGACASPFGVVFADARYTLDYTNAGADNPDPDTDGGTDEFDAYECVSGMCDSFAYTAIEEGSDSYASALATSIGDVDMY